MFFLSLLQKWGRKTTPFQGGEEVSIKLYKLCGLSETVGNGFAGEKIRNRYKVKYTILLYFRLVSMLANLSLILEKYSPVRLEEVQNYLTKQYEENLFEIYEGMLMLNEDKEPKMLSKEVEKIKKDFGFMFDDDGTIEEYVNTVMNGLQKLIDELKENEEEFYKEALNSDNPNFLITTYYSLYLRFVTKVYLKLQTITKTINDSRIKDIFNIAIFLVGFFGMPILLYIKKKEVFLHASELSGALLHALVADRTLVPSKDSWGYYLFFRIHADNS